MPVTECRLPGPARDHRLPNRHGDGQYTQGGWPDPEENCMQF